MDTPATLTDPALAPAADRPLMALTPLAAQKLQAALAEKNLAGYGLRVFVSGGGCSGLQYGMAFENTTAEGDAVFDSNGVRMYVDEESALYLTGATVDYVDELMHSGFRVDNPNAVTTCSCGESFGAAESEQSHGQSCGCGHH